MNIKGKILNLPGYYVFTQNEAGRCENRDTGKAKSKTDGTNPRKIIFQNFPRFFPNFPTFHALPRACTRLGRVVAREGQRVTGTRRSSSPATAMPAIWADYTILFLSSSRSTWHDLGLERSTGRHPTGGSKPRPAVPPPNSGEARTATKRLPKCHIFSRMKL